jgi:OOP family OmpA-OmpF porin
MLETAFESNPTNQQINKSTKMKNPIRLLAISSVSLLIAQGAAMAQNAPSNWYVGGAVGASSLKPKVNNQSIPGNQDTSDIGTKFFGGYKLSENWAAEVQYYDLGKWRYSDAGLTVSAKVTGWSISAVGAYPLSNGFSLLGKLGIATQDVKLRATEIASGDSEGAKADATVPVIGFGFEYAFNPRMSLRTEYEYFGVPTLVRVGSDRLRSHTSLVTVGLSYKF